MVDFVVRNLDAVIAGLHKKKDEFISASQYGVNQVAATVMAQAKVNSVMGGTHPAGTKTPATPGRGPARISGTLQRSITAFPHQGFGNYSVEVGPTVVYARKVELGWSSGVNYPYMIPAGLAVAPKANDIFTQAVLRRWQG